jgi:hypothetical protein
VPEPHKLCTKQIAAQKVLQNPWKKCVSHLGILQQLGANSTGTLEASQNHNENFGITQPERLVILHTICRAKGVFFAPHLC